jgi:hypothetical protein
VGLDVAVVVVVAVFVSVNASSPGGERQITSPTELEMLRQLGPTIGFPDRLASSNTVPRKRWLTGHQLDFTNTVR